MNWYTGIYGVLFIPLDTQSKIKIELCYEMNSLLLYLCGCVCAQIKHLQWNRGKPKDATIILVMD